MRSLKPRQLGVLVCALVIASLALVASGCGSGDSGSADTQAADGAATQATTAAAGGDDPAADDGSQSTDTGASEASSASGTGVETITPTECGQPVTYENDPNGLLDTLPAETQEGYELYPYEVRETPWSTFEGKEGPWTIGYISFPTDNSWKIAFEEELKKQFELAKEAGLVDELKTYIQPSWDTATPEQQNAAIQQMVRDGVDGILLSALDTKAETPAIDAAGEAGVPIVLIGDVAPDSEYAINVFGNNSANARADLLKLLLDKGTISADKEVNLLIVRGVPGPAVEEAQYEGGALAIEPCPGINVAGEVWGKWNPATTKTEILKFLASHPENIDMVFTDGGFAGVIQAFEQTGRVVPPTNSSGSSGGDLSWWWDNKDAYETTGYQFSGAPTAWTEFRILLRILAGNKPLLRDFNIPPALVNNDNLELFATPGQPVTWIGDTRMPVDMWADNAALDGYFEEPGTPGGL